MARGEVGVVVRPAHGQVVALVTLTARVAAGVETACTGGEREGWMGGWMDGWIYGWMDRWMIIEK